MRNIRLAVLLCDTIILGSPTIEAEHGDYRQIFHKYLATCLAKVSSDVTFTLDGYDVINDMANYPPDDAHYDGIFISGSCASVNDDLPWIRKLTAYAKYIITEKPSVKVFGICFGHQIVCKALGGTIKRGGWELAVTKINLTNLGKAIFQSHSKLRLQMLHHDQVTEYPSCAHLLGSSIIANNQGIVIFDPDSAPPPRALESDAFRLDLTTVQVFTVEGHPEFTGPIMVQLLYLSASELPPDMIGDAIARAMLPTDAIDKVGENNIVYESCMSELQVNPSANILLVEPDSMTVRITFRPHMQEYIGLARESERHAVIALSV